MLSIALHVHYITGRKITLAVFQNSPSEASHRFYIFVHTCSSWTSCWRSSFCYGLNAQVPRFPPFVFSHKWQKRKNKLVAKTVDTYNSFMKQNSLQMAGFVLRSELWSCEHSPRSAIWLMQDEQSAKPCATWWMRGESSEEGQRSFPAL